MNQLIQNFVITLAVLLIFMFGYLHLKPQVPQDKKVSLNGLYQTDFGEWRWLTDCSSKKTILLRHGTETLDSLYKRYLADKGGLLYVEVEGYYHFSATNGADLSRELIVETVIHSDIDKQC